MKRSVKKSINSAPGGFYIKSGFEWSAVEVRIMVNRPSASGGGIFATSPCEKLPAGFPVFRCVISKTERSMQGRSVFLPAPDGSGSRKRQKTGKEVCFQKICGKSEIK